MFLYFCSSYRYTEDFPQRPDCYYSFDIFSKNTSVFLTSTGMTGITEMENDNTSEGKTPVFLSRLLMFFILALGSAGPRTGTVAHIRPFTRCHKHKKGPKEDPRIIGSAAAAAELRVSTAELLPTSSFASYVSVLHWTSPEPHLLSPFLASPNVNLLLVPQLCLDVVALLAGFDISRILL